MDFKHEEWTYMDDNIDDDEIEIQYLISSCCRVKKETIKDGYLVEQFLTPSFRDGNIYYSLYLGYYKYKLKSMTKLMKKYWPNVDLKNIDRNRLSYQIKDQNTKEIQQSQGIYLDYVEVNSRSCAKCGKPSGVNYWCKKCRKKRQDKDKNPYQWGPEECYDIHL